MTRRTTATANATSRRKKPLPRRTSPATTRMRPRTTPRPPASGSTACGRLTRGSAARATPAASRPSTTYPPRRASCPVRATRRAPCSPGWSATSRLVEAIESGIVKIPRVPVDDNATTPNVQYLNLWPGIKDGLPKKGRKPRARSPPTRCPACSKARSTRSTTPTRRRTRLGESRRQAVRRARPRLHRRLQQHHRLQDGLRLHRRLREDHPTATSAVLVPGKLTLFSNIDSTASRSPGRARSSSTRCSSSRARAVRRVQEDRRHRDRGVQRRVRAHVSPAATPRTSTDADSCAR